MNVRNLTRERASTATVRHDGAELQVAMVDFRGAIVTVNQAWRNSPRRSTCFCIACVRRGENILAACRRAGTPGARLLAGFQAVLAGRQPGFSWESCCHSGRQHQWFLISATRLVDPERGVIVVRENITRQKQADAARAQLAAIVESSTSGISAATLNGIITSWNTGAERLYGYTADEILGKSLRCVVPRNRLHELQENCERVKRGEHVEQIETLRRHKDGHLIPVALTLSPIRDSAGTIVGISGIARDITDRRRLETEVLQVTEREERRIAQDLHDGLGQQIAGTSCLANVLQKNLAREHSPDAPMARRIASLLKDAAAQARGLAHGLYPVPLHPRGLMSALDGLARRTQELLQVNCSFPANPTVLVRDSQVANHLYGIAQEAVENAVRHGRAQHIEIVLRQNRSQIVLAVRDDGIGIRASRRPHKGIGIRIMNYRANLISGTLAVQRLPAGGTEVVCNVHRQLHEQIPSTKKA